MKIKRLFIMDVDSPSERKTLCWQDEHGSWRIGSTNSPIGFAQGVMGSPGTADRHTEGPHPELVMTTLYTDWFARGEDGPSYELETIVDPVIIEAWRRWNAGFYANLPAGDIELPVPGRWQISPNGFEIERLGDS